MWLWKCGDNELSFSVYVGVADQGGRLHLLGGWGFVGGGAHYRDVKRAPTRK